MKVTPEIVRVLLDYDPATGLLKWRERGAEFFPGKRGQLRNSIFNRAFAGMPALATETEDGYLCGKILQKRVLAHRAAFAYVYGVWPEQVDHINGNRRDNRIANLRSVDHITNCRNRRRVDRNTSGVTGVVYCRGKWLASITIDQKRRHIGSFDSLLVAAEARKAAEVKHGFHANHGR